jgi:hypothetical protein
MELLYDPAIPLLGLCPKSKLIYSREVHTHVYHTTSHHNQAMELAQVLANKGMDKKVWYIYTVWIIWPQKRTKSCYLQENEWN